MVVVGALVLGGCSSPDGRLEALRADPLATLVVSNATEIRISESAGSYGPGKPAPSVIRRTFEIDQTLVAETLDGLAEQAVAAGWDVVRDGAAYTGTRRLDEYDAQLRLSAITGTDRIAIELRSSTDP